MNTIRGHAYSKLNLTLDITGSEGGYHMLDSLVCTVDLSDKIVVKKRKDRNISVTMRGLGQDIPPERNNALRAGEAFVKAFSTTGADVTIYKNIPVGAGLGGSSADAAGVLKLLAALYDISDMGALKSLADTLGSDTGYLLTGGFARLRGRGERVESLGELADLNFLLLLPGNGVSTEACYRRYDEAGVSYPPRTERVLEALRTGDIGGAARLFGNHLFEAAKDIEPDVYDALVDLRTFSPLGAGMTGSGSACFAVFETRELCEWAKSRYRGKHRAYILSTTKTVKEWKSPFSIES